MLAPLLKDAYKAFHHRAYNPLVTHVYSNFTNRFNKHSNVKGNKAVVFFGLQRMIIKVLIRNWNKSFFQEDKAEVVAEYNRVISAMLGKPIDTKHIEDLWDLGYLPIEIKALPEGSLVPYGVPPFTITNTVSGFGWVVNMLETVISAEMWGISTSATTAYYYRKRFEESSLPKDMIKFMGHDFSYRGMFGTEAAAMSGLGHLTSFVGSDVIPAALEAEEYYDAKIDKELVFSSVDATEHSVMCSYEQAGELESLKHLITKVTPTGIISIVSDTWDFWKLVTEYLPALKDVILGRDGTVVIRPDSGDPVKILCGDPESPIAHENKGLIECLWDIFSGTVDASGLKVLHKNIGAIYGDSITLERQDEIITRLEAKGFLPLVVLGIGSYTYQYVTRDTHGSAVKATDVQMGEGNHVAISKDPKTDSSKKSAKGLLMVVKEADGTYGLLDDVDPMLEGSELNRLEPVFKDGVLLKRTTLNEVRKLIDSTF
ncbi:nicotinate phosphoribosyltransferase [Pseudoalteromonas phage vB_PtuP_Slicky01]|nr:nicotinate phosphoribosyltransferase [Pseudoalteromonas phage vB_PtuP_Slicky01]